MKAIWACLFLACIAALAGCLNPSSEAKMLAEKAVTAQLKDPDSAKFGDAFVVVTPAKESPGLEDVAVCGLVNAKNGFGGYTGDQRYVAYGFRHVGGTNTTIVAVNFENLASEQQCETGRENAFEQFAWNVHCFDDAHPKTYSGGLGSQCR